MVDFLYDSGLHLSTHFFWVTYAWPVLWTLIKIVAVLLPLLGCVAYLTLWERKAIGYTQIRKGPNRTGPGGLLQPIADALTNTDGLCSTLANARTNVEVESTRERKISCL